MAWIAQADESAVARYSLMLRERLSQILANPEA